MKLEKRSASVPNRLSVSFFPQLVTYIRIFKSIASLKLQPVICVRILMENSIICCALANFEIKVWGPIIQPIFVVFPKSLDNEPTYKHYQDQSLDRNRAVFNF